MQTQVLSRYRFVIEASILPLQIVVGLNFFAPAPLFPQIIEAYHIDKATVSLLISGSTLVLAILSVPAGIIAARMGLKQALILGGILTAAGLLTPVAPNFAFLVVLRMLYAAGAAIVVPAASGIAMQWFSSKELPIINGLNLMGQSLGVSLSMFLGLGLAEALGGWKAPLFIYGLVASISVIAWILLGKTHGAKGTISTIRIADAISILPQRNTLLLGLAVIGPFAQYVALTSWLPTYYREVRGMSPGLTSLVTGILPFVGIAATFLGGVLPSRVGLRKPFLVIPGLLLGVSGVLSFISGNIAITLVGIIMLGILSWIFTPTVFTIPMELPGTSPEKVSVITSTALAMGNFSSFLSPLAIGLIADSTGRYEPGFALWALVSLSLLVSALLLPETGPNAKKAVPAESPVRAGQ